MSCDIVQRRLLSLSSPQRPPAELRAHLANCPVCGPIQQRLVELERQVTQVRIPLPPTDGMDRVIHRVLTDPTLWASVRGRRPVMSRPWQKLLAAAMVLLALGGTFLAYLRTQKPPAGPSTPAVDVLLAQVMKRNVNLATATAPEQRMKELAAMADDLQAGTSNLSRVAKYGDDLTALAQMYDRVVRKGLLDQAQKLTAPEDRQRVLVPLADRLDARGQEAARLAAEVPAPSAAALRTMAQTARDAARQVRALIAGRAV